MRLVLRVSIRAGDDLTDIFEYIARDDPRAATRVIRAIAGRIEDLRKEPKRGRTCSDVRPGLMRCLVGKYLIFYRTVDDRLEIVRVLHGARDWENILGADDAV